MSDIKDRIKELIDRTNDEKFLNSIKCEIENYHDAQIRNTVLTHYDYFVQHPNEPYLRALYANGIEIIFKREAN